MRKLSPLLIFVLAFTFAGCGQNKPTAQNEAELTVQPIQAAVPPEVEVLLEENAEFDFSSITHEPMFDPPFPEANDAGWEVFSVTVLWGYLANVPVVSAQGTDWSGRLWSPNEILVDVRFTIDFEPDEDSIIVRDAPVEAQWVSYTGFDLDGISFLVYRKLGVADESVPVLVFETAPITLKLPFHQLEQYLAYYPVGNGQGLAVLAKRIWPGGCPGGTIRGRWLPSTLTNSQGTMNGLWFDYNGEPIGYYSGEFSTNNDGSREFSGSVSGYVTDQVIAEFKGEWWFTDYRLCPVCGDDFGQFIGRVRWLEDNSAGIMKGSFGDPSILMNDGTAMPMVGVWKKRCNYVSTALTGHDAQ